MSVFNLALPRLALPGRAGAELREQDTDRTEIVVANKRLARDRHDGRSGNEGFGPIIDPPCERFQADCAIGGAQLLELSAWEVRCSR